MTYQMTGEASAGGVMVSKLGHCLNDASSAGVPKALGASVGRGVQPRGPPSDGRGGRVAVPARARDTQTTKRQAEERLLELVDEYRADLVWPGTCRCSPTRPVQPAVGRSTSSSLLPGFKGAKPYHQSTAV